MTKNDIIKILDDLILNCEQSGTEQGKNLYIDTRYFFLEESIDKRTAKILYHNFCGYQAHADLSDCEYNKVNSIIRFFEKLFKNKG